MPEPHPNNPCAPVDVGLVEAGAMFLMQVYGQDAELFTGIGSTEAQRVALAASRITPANRAALARWFTALQHEGDLFVETVLQRTLGLEFHPRGWEHPDGLPQHGARALLLFLLQGLQQPQASR